MDRPYRDLAQTLAHGASVGGYLIEERIGVGGFGEVYSARQPTIDRRVAIKILHARFSNDAGALTRFVDEARAVNQIAHPNIVEIYDFGSHDGRAYIVMELLEGELLRAVLDTCGRMPLAQALPMLRQIAEALDAAHALGIAHRDLKPDNVFVTSDGRTKLIDFGIAKLTHEDSGLTETGAVFGTPHYMSPEQCRGRGVGTRTDMYSFGALAYRMLTGEPPFSGDPIELALHHLNDRPEPPSTRAKGAGLTRQTDRVLLALLAKAPDERPATLGSAVAALAGEARLQSDRVSRGDLRTVATIGGGMAVAMVVLGGLMNVAEDYHPATEVAPGTGAGSQSCDDDRAAAVWSPDVRGALAKKFAAVDGPDAAMVWHVNEQKLDHRVARWQTDRVAACRAARERDSDPLRYGQRLACLDRVLVQLRGSVALLTAIDAKDFISTGDLEPGVVTTRLADCENEDALRAQVPPPKEAVRARVAELELAVDRATIAGWIAQFARDVPAIDQAAAELAGLAAQLRALDPPSAAPALLSRVQLLEYAAADSDVGRWPAVREAAEQARDAIEGTHDPRALAYAYVLLASVEVSTPQSPTPRVIDTIAWAVQNAEAAVQEAGNPLGARIAVARARVEESQMWGELPKAVAAARTMVDLASGDDPLDDTGEADLVTSLALAGQAHDADVEAQRWLGTLARTTGDTFAFTAHQTRSSVLQLAGDLAGALGERDAAIEIARRQSPAPVRNVWGLAYRTDLALQVPGKEPPQPASIVRLLPGMGATPPRQLADGVATARRAGLWALVEHAIAQPEPDADAMAASEHAARLAFARGDTAAAATASARVVAACAADRKRCRDTVWFARWIALVAAGGGNMRQLHAQLAALEADYDGDAGAIANSGIVLAALGQWPFAKVRLETARTARTWEMQADLADLDAWLGRARLAAPTADPTMDRVNARLAFEESLAALGTPKTGMPGFTATQPVVERALADMMWTAGDHVRARSLAQRALAGFARLGEGRETERRETVAWLDAHP